MTHRRGSFYRRPVVATVLGLSLAAGALQWVVVIRPRAESSRERAELLQAERRRLAQTRMRLLELGSEGIAEQNRRLRGEVERREALAPAGTLEGSALEVRERFAALAARYGVHAPAFESVPVRTVGDLQVGGLRIRASGPYHALGTWITEGLAHPRLLDVRSARLAAVPDSLTRSLRDESAVVTSVPAPSEGGTLALPGAQPLDAVVELVVQWYALPHRSAPAEPAERA